MHRYIETETERAAAIKQLEAELLPFVLSVSKGSKRSLRQNRLQRLWCKEVALQLGDRTEEDVRGYCKLNIGVPILREENESFREQYDRVIKPLTYEQKLALMMVPLDFPITRLMTMKQKTRYLEWLYDHFTGFDLQLTSPEQFEAAAGGEQENGEKSQGMGGEE